MLSNQQGKEVGTYHHCPFTAHNFVNESLLENKFTFQIATAAFCVLVISAFRLISPLCQVAHLATPHSIALGKKVFWGLDVAGLWRLLVMNRAQGELFICYLSSSAFLTWVGAKKKNLSHFPH